jgi:hypothetical protein
MNKGPFSGIREMFRNMDELFEGTFDPLPKEYSDMEPGTEKEIVSTEKKSDGTTVISTITIKKTVRTVQSTTKKSST